MQLGNGTKSPGDLDKTFAIDGRIEIAQRGTANAIASDKYGGLILAVQENNRFVLSRFDINGVKDLSFQETIANFVDGDISIPARILVQEDGNIILLGISIMDRIQSPAVMKFSNKGVPNLVFGRRILPVPDESVMPFITRKFLDGCLQHGDKILIMACHKTGQSERPLSRLYCLEGNGEFDKNFGDQSGFFEVKLHGHPSYVTDVQTQQSGIIILAGSWRYPGEPNRTRTVARYTPKGGLDLTFARAGFADIPVPEESNIEPTDLNLTEPVNRVYVQKDDKILIAGHFNGRTDVGSALLARLDRNGSVDAGFNGGAALILSQPSKSLTFTSIAVQTDEKIVVVGGGDIGGVTKEYYVRLSADGTPEDFQREDSDGDCSDVVVQPSGRIVISGSSGKRATGVRHPRVSGRLGN